MSSQNFRQQQTFVLNVAFVLLSGELAAVQYGSTTSPISRLTADLGAFALAVDSATQLLSPTTAAGSGINFCIGQLLEKSGKANKIVLLGDGRSSVGPNAVRSADAFRLLGGEVCAVGVGSFDASELLAIAGGDPEKVFEFNDEFDLAFSIVNLADRICGDAPEVTERTLN